MKLKTLAKIVKNKAFSTLKSTDNIKTGKILETCTRNGQNSGLEIKRKTKRM